jgi:CRP-like cAMP-binding protein
MKKNAQIDLLRGVWLFERCSRAELALVASVATNLDVPAGRVLAREGDLGREFFVIVSGSADVTRNGVIVGMLGPGSFFGEMALLDRQTRTATVTTGEPAEILVLTKGAFTGVIDTMPSVDRKMLAVLAARLRDLEDRFLPAERYLPAAERRVAAERNG